MPTVLQFIGRIATTCWLLKSPLSQSPGGRRPKQSFWAPATPKVRQEGVDSQSEPSMASLGFGVSRAKMAVFGFVSEFSECSKIPSRADPRPLCCFRSTDSAANACTCASHSLSLCVSSGSHSFSLFSLLYLHFLQQHPVTYVSLSGLLPASRSCFSLLSNIF